VILGVLSVSPSIPSCPSMWTSGRSGRFLRCLDHHYYQPSGLLIIPQSSPIILIHSQPLSLRTRLSPIRHFAKKAALSPKQQQQQKQEQKRKDKDRQKDRKKHGPPGSDGTTGINSSSSSSGSGRGGDSVAALAAENESRLAPYVVEIMESAKQVNQRAQEREHHRSEDEKIQEWLYEEKMSRRSMLSEVRHESLISLKLRRRWEALNGLTEELRDQCMKEDRTLLPEDFPHPRDAWGQLIIPDQPGLSGGHPLTFDKIKQLLDEEQQRKDRGLDW